MNGCGIIVAARITADAADLLGCGAVKLTQKIQNRF
jgi:hypothetical protein